MRLSAWPLSVCIVGLDGGCAELTVRLCGWVDSAAKLSEL